MAALPAHADTDQTGILSYPASFFADARPNTAYDMIGRLPGFVFDDGNTARGFAGTAGNVVIDGQRPTSKTDDLQSILYRIPAADVDHIDVIRGGAPGIDMHGQTVMANVVRKKGDSTQIVLDVEDNLFLLDGHSIPYGSVQYTQHSGDSTYEGSITRYGNFDDSVGNGFHDVTDETTGVVTHQNAHTSGIGTGGGMTAAATVPFLGGQFKANLALQSAPFDSGLTFFSAGGNQTITDMNANTNGELGLHWNGDAGAAHIETLFLQRLGHQTDVNASLVTGNDQIFTSSANTGESIARGTVRYLPMPTLTLETGAEGAYNFLDGKSTFVQNGAFIPLPSANARVEEKRGETFGQASWKISDQWMVEAGARFEYSIIGETGDVAMTRTFSYPKPRAIVTWSPDKDTQVRLRYERVLGQLDFNNFIASSSLSSTGVSGGNANLRPDDHTQYELSFERHFWGKGAAVVKLLHESIEHVVDYIPVTNSSGTFDAPGNIGTGRNDQIDVELTLPLDKLGLPNGLLKSTDIWRLSSVRDPVTGLNRVISGERPQDIEIHFSQDITRLKSTWGMDWYNCWDEYYFRLSQERHRRVIPPYLDIYWEYKPTPSWSLHFELDDFGRFAYDDQNYFYSGDRGLSPLSSKDEVYIRSQPRLYVQIRKTFG
jgi:hypothetical protein